MTPRLKNIYEKEILPKLMTKLNCTNKHQAPKISKIVLNVGLGEDASDGKKVKSCQDDITSIAGQKAVKTKAKKVIDGILSKVDGDYGTAVGMLTSSLGQ